jgi:hypothetical protein
LDAIFSLFYETTYVRTGQHEETAMALLVRATDSKMLPLHKYVNAIFTEEYNAVSASEIVSMHYAGPFGMETCFIRDAIMLSLLTDLFRAPHSQKTSAVSLMKKVRQGIINYCLSMRAIC